jgi:hypothetical protein
VSHRRETKISEVKFQEVVLDDCGFFQERSHSPDFFVNLVSHNNLNAANSTKKGFSQAIFANLVSDYDSNAAKMAKKGLFLTIP